MDGCRISHLLIFAPYKYSYACDKQHSHSNSQVKALGVQLVAAAITNVSVGSLPQDVFPYLIGHGNEGNNSAR